MATARTVPHGEGGRHYLSYDDRWRTFVVLQILGGVFGLFTQLSYAGMVRYASLPFANATGIGLAFVSAQVFSAALLLREPFTLLQWAGTGVRVRRRAAHRGRPAVR